MNRFNLLGELKEMESTEHINHTFRIPRRHLSYSDILTLGPFDISNILTSGRSHDIGMPTSRDLLMLSHACKPASKDFSQ